MRRKMLSWFLISCICTTLMPNGMLINAESLEGDLLNSEEFKVYYLQEKGEPSESGYQEYEWVDEDGRLMINEATEKEADIRLFDDIVGAQSFPSSYDMRDVDGENYLPAIRSQGVFGTCWAHAALASMETNMIKKGYADLDVDYSERHLSYFAHSRNPITGDGVNSATAEYGKYDGGNAQQAMTTLASWYGAANEEDFPYEECSATDTIDEAYRTVSEVHLTEASNLLTASDIKRAVMENGAVQGSYYAETSDGEFIWKTGVTETNHAISIIGWDDNMDKANFTVNGNTPTTNGAWLCRNSWGTWWGNEGYFWLSYEDSSLGYFWSFEAEPASARDYIYQYDGAGYNIILTGCDMAANAFTAGADHLLKEVGFYTYEGDNYKVEVFLGEEETFDYRRTTYYTFPEKPVATASGQVKFGGYHTVDLDKEVWLDKGQRFIIVVHLESGRWLMEGGANYSAGSNESYLRYATYGKQELWMDCTASGQLYYNIGIKAIVDDAPELVAREYAEPELSMEFTAEEVPTQEALENKLPKTVSVITDLETRDTTEVSVKWETDDSFFVTGGTYHYTGNLKQDDTIYVPENLGTVTLTVTVDPVIIENPVFEDISILMDEKRTAADAKDLGQEILPVSGEITVGKNTQLTYRIEWDDDQTIDLSDLNAVTEFAGAILYEEVPDWITLPQMLTVTRKVSVVEPDFHQITLPTGSGYEASSVEGYNAGKVYVGRDYRFVLNVKEGYDLSSVIVTVKGAQAVPEDCIYTIKNVCEDITDIVVENVQLKNTLYESRRTADNKLYITPVAPATGIKLADDTEYQDSLLLGGTEDVEIVLQDDTGIESTKETVKALEDLVLTEILSDVPKQQKVPVNKMYTLEELKDNYLPAEVEFATTEGINWNLKVTWTTESTYDVKGATYVFKGSLEDDGSCSNVEEFSFETTIIVPTVTVENPVFAGVTADWRKGTVANAMSLGATLLPTTGVVNVEELVNVNYQITWDNTQTINLENVGEKVQFTGTIRYTDAPEWLTGPETDIVSRVITVGVAEDDSKNNIEEAQGEIPLVGTVLTVGTGIYKITKTDAAGGTVEFIGVAGKGKKIIIPATITVDGSVYKVTGIGKGAFKNNKKVTSVTIGKYVTTIGKQAFYKCKKLAKIQIKGTKLKSVGKNALKGIKSNAQIKVPKKKLSAYKKLLKRKGQNKNVKIKK